tara:strand:- start:251 stop:1813 length:1563 start_codon:yes stop_codon:yes gene_type:complete
MKIVFIADFFKDDLIGGAEVNDSVLISRLSDKGVVVKKIKCHNLSDEDIITNDVFIVSNFVNMSERHKNMIMIKKYIIYEHDHKYLRSRNPSVFPSFEPPESELVNVEFYKKAHKVVVLSEICKTILEKSLKIDNVISIGCSLWSKEKLNFIETISNIEKTKNNFIINSNNRIKGTKNAVSYCKREAMDYDLIGPLPEKELLKEISKYKTFIFIPQVLETLSRIVVEAKMLGCNIMTVNKLIGASYEPWFSKNGIELIKEIRKKVDNAVETFYNLLQNETVTAILNCYRRPEYLEEQIRSLKNQTIKPDEIWIWVNYHEDNKDIDFSKFDCDRVIKNDYNWKFYGRFAGALLSNNKYIAMFDDDTIPGNMWLENCLSTMKTHEGILGGAGVVLPGDRYYGHTRYGWSSQNEEVVEVDLVGHAWFFKREWLRFLWMEKPFTWENGEDIQFSYCAQKYGGIKTYCPPHPNNNKEMFSSLKGYEMGVDEKATSRARNHHVFYAQRDACVKNAVLNGWKIVKDD